MLRKRRKASRPEEAEMDLMPMIDIIFQLLLFFILSAKFIAFEGQLQAYLPKDRGDKSPQEAQELVNVTFELAWDAATQKVACYTFDYDPPAGGERQRSYRFRDDAAVVEGVRDGKPAAQTETRIGVGRNEKISYDYAVPDFIEIEEYLAHRKAVQQQRAGKLPPVTVNFGDGVPWQMVVNILDSCTRLELTDFSINAQEIEN
jgi:biopolymer transport protein ExbD